MMSTSFGQLRYILNATESVHKKDISDFAKGHLNESHLLKKEREMLTGRHWETAYDRPTTPVISSYTPAFKPDDKRKRKEMTDVLCHFALGTAGGKLLRQLDTQQYMDSTAANDSESLYSIINDDVLMEEYMSKPICNLPSIGSDNRPSSKQLREKETLKRPGSKSKPRIPIDSEFRDILKLRNVIQVPGSLHGATKRDQLNNRKRYEAHLIRPQDATRKGVFTGHEMVADIELQLLKELKELSLDDGGPTDEKLSVYKKGFERLIGNSQTFSHVLSIIKIEYDRYLDHLRSVLNSSSHHELVQSQVRQLTAGGTSRPGEMDEVKRQLEGAEARAEAVYEENLRLKEMVQKQMATQSSPMVTYLNVKQPSHDKIEVADEIEHVKASILEKMDKMERLRQNMKTQSVPTSVCNDLEMCIKDTEIEVQKYLKQNEYFEQSIAENETLLKAAIVDADTSEKDARRIWDKVNSHYRLGSELYSSEAMTKYEEEETKWAWYIS